MRFVLFYFVCMFLWWVGVMWMGMGVEEGLGLWVWSMGKVGGGVGGLGGGF